MSGDIAISFAVGDGELAEKARYLTNSIKTYTSNPEIHTFASTDEWESLSAREQNFFDTETTVATGELPIAGYPISAKLAAMKHAASVTTRPFLLLLDTDTVVLNEIEYHSDGSAELFVKRADGSDQYWISEEAEDDWKRAYSLFNSEYPGYTSETSETGVPIPPYWNAGFVLTSDKEFPSEWLSATRTVYQSNLSERFFADQVALGVLSTQYEVEEVSELYNYPLPFRYRCPSNIRVLHYHDFQPCGRIVTPLVRAKLRQIGLTQSHSFPSSGDQLRLLAGVGLRLFNIK
jgi:hypothetical protein